MFSDTLALPCTPAPDDSFYPLAPGLDAPSRDVRLAYNIDCGSDSDVSTDENFGIWMGDNLFMQNGVTRVVQSSKSISHVMDTLRFFTTRKKNCYSIKADKGEKVLVRASFFYGNYDNKASPPTFDLQFDGNDWATVETSSDELVYHEVIYVVKGETTSVCVAQTKPNQFPFMSALQIHSLDSLMYSHVDSNFALFLSTRVAYGANETIRDLSSFGLFGLLPDFSSMDAIETIDLHNNSLVGAIPDFLGTFPNLKELVTGNPNLCASGNSCETSDTPISSNIPSTSYSGSKKKKNKLPVILGTTIPSFLVVWAIAGVLAILRHKRKKASVAAVGAG
ncbi:hypothetical protein RJ640_015385 [Escallonia rubra]|uniref:Malectin-like domain-containing protein n=1 Tax=Escallonia rubra TaxID=112253 RepID=A0AA88UJT9_9ASTE|nr:hypothetical protein RJ640_015385 [Escallonia rubra]